MNKFILCCFLPFFGLVLFGQQDLSLPLLGHLGQQSAVNPAYRGDFTYYIGLPDISLDFYYSGLSLGNLLEEENGVRLIDVEAAIDELRARDNWITTNLYAQSYRLAYQAPKWSVHHFKTARFQSDVQYPKALAQLAWQGNAPFIGQSLEVGPSFEVFSYDEIGVGGAFQLGRFRFGANFKLLTGIGVAKSQNHSATVFTDQDIYQLELTTDYEVLAADLDGNIDYVDFGIVQLDFSDITLLSFRLPRLDIDISNAFFKYFSSSNKGFALDIGFVFEPNDQWYFGLSVLDVGTIHWEENAVIYHSQDNRRFEGLNLGNIDFTGTSSIFSLEELRDSLAEIIHFTQTPTSFSTSLAEQAYLQCRYTPNAYWAFGAAFYGRFGRNTSWGTSVGANYKIRQFMNIGMIYAAQKESWFNLGLNITFQIAPFQLFFITNNIFTAFEPINTTNQTARVGAALFF